MSKIEKKKVLITVLITIAIAVCLATGVLAYLSLNSGPVANSFTPAADTDPVIAESFDKKIKSNVKVNVGDPGYAVFVRAAILVTWKDSSGKVLADKPVLGTDYSMNLNSTDWFEKDGFYYHVSSVNSGTTSVLIETAKPLKDAPESGYSLSIELISQTIQAHGTTDIGNVPAATAAWGVTVVDGKLSNT